MKLIEHKIFFFWVINKRVPILLALTGIKVQHRNAGSCLLSHTTVRRNQRRGLQRGILFMLHLQKQRPQSHVTAQLRLRGEIKRQS